MLMIHCLNVFHIFLGCVFGLCFVVQYKCPLYLSNHLAEEERAGCFTLIVILKAYDC